MVTTNCSYRDFGDNGKLNFRYCHIISMFSQMYTANVLKQTIFRDYSVYFYSRMRSVQSNAPNHGLKLKIHLLQCHKQQWATETFCSAVSIYSPGGGWGTPYNGLYGDVPPERGTFFRLEKKDRNFTS